MSKTVVHVERHSPFLRALQPICPCCEGIQFGWVDCVTIVFTLTCFVSLVCVLAG